MGDTGFCVIEETFAIFYDKHHLEYDEAIVMEAFFDAIRDIKEWDAEALTPKIISDTVGHTLSKQQYEDWTNIFAMVCSNSRYQWVITS